MKLCKVLCSSCRQEILISLASRTEVPIMNLVKTVNSTWNEVNRNLCILEKEGIIIQQRIRHKRIINLNLENRNTILLLTVLKDLEGLTDKRLLNRNSVVPHETI